MLEIGNLAPVGSGCDALASGGTCLPCRISKVRCDKTIPCGRCRRRNMTCVAQTQRERRRRSRVRQQLQHFQHPGRDPNHVMVPDWQGQGDPQYFAAMGGGGVALIPMQHGVEDQPTRGACQGRVVLEAVGVTATAAPNAWAPPFHNPHFGTPEAHAAHLDSLLSANRAFAARQAAEADMARATRFRDSDALRREVPPPPPRYYGPYEPFRAARPTPPRPSHQNNLIFHEQRGSSSPPPSPSRES
ncbi:hypothetical protein CTAYLR_008469 [Chrysophaeum taylorii]|uniref:Zn(2)-C6 fungal-type domain-containing protein n=1 Tax=Chrysophaeum taylorii TaxID=2483200 RepID=A0AAD7UIA3_9STRA|nr:hypothetical protein CTAYLR_008469 [Chrysophaeum taylorii]